MSSTRRIIASRANGAQSGGPVSLEGKQRSALNAIQHGLAARAIVIKGESQDDFRTYLGRYAERFLPADEVELSLVEEMAAAAWRLRRAWTIEGCLFDSHIDEKIPATPSQRIAVAFVSLASGPQFGLMHRYESRLHLSFHRALSSLTSLQKARMQNEPSPISGHDPDVLDNLTVEDPMLANYNEGD